MYIFGGFDGTCKNDLHCFNFNTNTWTLVNITHSSSPKPRYLAAATVYKDEMFIFGGHDESHTMNDFYAYNFSTEQWIPIDFHSGIIPSPRNSHTLVTFVNSIYLFGGSTTVASDLLYEYKVEESRWYTINSKSGELPTARYGHSSVISNKVLYVFGGYNGKQRFNELFAFKFEDPAFIIPKGTLLQDLKNLINKETFSDVTILLDGNKKVKAHKLFLTRIPYFAAMFGSEMKESKTQTVNIEKVSYENFLLVLQYLYTDECEIPLENAMEIFEIADRFGIERLRQMAEQTIMTSLKIDNAANILLVFFYNKLIKKIADTFHADPLRNEAMRFILKNFDEVSKVFFIY